MHVPQSDSVITRRIEGSVQAKDISERVVAVMLCLALTSQAAFGQQRARGISFLIDTATFTENALPAGPDILRVWQAFGSFSARVTFAANRGRLDVTRRRDGHAIVDDSLISTAPLANVGDYYLFDSTAVLLVRPRSKTYSLLPMLADSYNGARSREGWPRAFRPAAMRIDTVDAAQSSPAKSSRQIHLYWHIDRVPYKWPDAEIARGAITVATAPFGEFNVIQWFGASRALSRMSVRGDALPARLTLTTATPLTNVVNADEVPPTILLKRELLHLRSEEIPLLSLTLPADFSETPWAGQHVAPRAEATPSSIEKWRKVPGP
jgi:hypothetical protein